MMKSVATLFLALLPCAAPAPAVVWTSSSLSSLQSTTATVHSSDEVKAGDLVRQALLGDGSSTLAEESMSSTIAVVFLLGRHEDGSESLSKLASEGLLPGVASKYNAADTIHYHSVTGLDSSFTVASEARKVAGREAVLEVTLDEFASKLNMLDENDDNEQATKVKMTTKRARDLQAATALVVKVDLAASSEKAEAAEKIDAAVVRAIEHRAVRSVVLGGLRSAEEVKLERDLFYRRRLDFQMQSSPATSTSRLLSVNSHRRLEDKEENQNNNNQNSDMSGVYYVSMTPNILAGLLFTFMFATVIWIGLSCMGAISGQDVYVNKMPSIGREA